jgi:hypothetical protein
MSRNQRSMAECCDISSHSPEQALAMIVRDGKALRRKPVHAACHAGWFPKQRSKLRSTKPRVPVEPSLLGFVDPMEQGQRSKLRSTEPRVPVEPSLPGFVDQMEQGQRSKLRSTELRVPVEPSLLGFVDPMGQGHRSKLRSTEPPVPVEPSLLGSARASSPIVGVPVAARKSLARRPKHQTKTRRPAKGAPR